MLVISDGNINCNCPVRYVNILKTLKIVEIIYLEYIINVTDSLEQLIFLTFGLRIFKYI